MTILNLDMEAIRENQVGQDFHQSCRDKIERLSRGCL